MHTTHEHHEDTARDLLKRSREALRNYYSAAQSWGDLLDTLEVAEEVTLQAIALRANFEGDRRKLVEWQQTADDLLRTVEALAEKHAEHVKAGGCLFARDLADALVEFAREVPR